MKRRILVTLLGLLLAAGCAARPGHELENARQALANADAIGAREMAEAEYLAAEASLRHAEALVRQREYQAAREILPFATEQARRAFEQTVAAKQELARQQALQAEAPRRQVDPQPRETRPAGKPPLIPPKVKPEAAKPSRYVVILEENLWDIASKPEVYGEGMLWPLLYQANRDQIKDPLKVYPGQTLIIPRDISPQDLEAVRNEAVDAGIFQQQLQLNQSIKSR